MDKKKVIAIVSILAVFTGTYLLFENNSKMNKKEIENQTETANPITENNLPENKATKAETPPLQKTSANEIKGEIQKTNTIKHGNLYSAVPSGSLPLSAIYEIANLPQNIQDGINKIIENSNNILLLERKSDNVLIITENSENIRHGVDFIEISIPTGHQIHTTLGYNGKIQDSENDKWEYDTSSPAKLPLKHTKFNKDGDVEFIENWNYNSENPIKYEMKNADGKILSIRKETIKDNTDMRIEHLIYDSDGNTKVNVSTTYEGADLKRFTYYNADKLSDSVSLFSDYENGFKVKETVYSSDLKLKNIYKSDYQDGERENIFIFDSNNRKIETIQQ